MTLPAFNRFCDVRGELPKPWPGGRFRWAFVGGDPGNLFDDLHPRDVKAAFYSGFACWSQVCGVRPEYTTRPRLADVAITVELIAPWIAQAQFDLGRPLRLAFNAAESWTVGPPGLAGFDLWRVAARMAGHAIGLKELPKGNLMGGVYDLGIDRPQEGDIAAARWMYGEPVEPLPPDAFAELDWIEAAEPTVLPAEDQMRRAA